MKKLLKNTVIAILIWEAKRILKKYKPMIIVVGGDVGKTTTKDAIYSAITPDLPARKSSKSFNSETGLPLSIIGVKESGWNSPMQWIKIIWRGFQVLVNDPKYPKFLVLELGDRKPGDSKRLAEWIKPHVLVLTRVDDIPTHVEFFDSIQGSRDEKQDLLQAVRREGLVIYDANDTNADSIVKANMTDRFSVQTYSTSTENIGNLTMKNTTITKKVDHFGMETTVVINDTNYNLYIPDHLGLGTLAAAGASLLVAKHLGVSIASAIANFSDHPDLPPGRLRLIPGVKKSLLLDDTYNAGFASTKLALDTLQSVPDKKRSIALLADMLELGEHSEDAHAKIGIYAVNRTNILVCVGKLARTIAENARKAGMNSKRIYTFSNAREAGKFVEQMIEAGDVVLIKGSQSMRMEHATQEMMLHPEERGRLLVRQEREWLRR